MHCRMCIRAIKTFAGPDMDFGLFKKIINEWVPALRYLSMDGPGETVMNPNAFRMIQYAKSRGVRVMFSTNAALLDPDMAAAIMDSGLDLIIFSVNGSSPDVYETVHGCNRYHEIVANIRQFLSYKKARQSPILVAIQMILLPETLGQAGAFYRQWQRIPGVDIVRVKKDVVQVENACLKEFGRHAKRRNPCSRLWHGPVYVEPNGDVYASPGVLFKADPVGNLKEQTLSQVWNNERMQGMRRAHVAEDFSGIPECAECAYPRPRLPLILAGFLSDPFTAGKYIALTEKMAFLHRLRLYEPVRFES